MRRFFVPEVVQASGMDCGPAALKCLLEGWGIPVSYGRLREACQTSIDGTSIDTMEAAANQLGLQAEQIVIPADHVLLPPAKALPAIAVVTLPSGLTHFVVIWRRHRNRVQVMDPAVGRRWVSCEDFTNELYQHTMPVPASFWREFAISPEFSTSLAFRLKHLGAARQEAEKLIYKAADHPSWQGLATLDAAIRLTSALVQAGGVRKGDESCRFLKRVCEAPELIPDRYWSALSGSMEDGEEQVIVRGAVLVRATGRRARTENEQLAPELAAALQEKPFHSGRVLLGLFRESGISVASLLLPAIVLAAAGTIAEALLFRGLFDVASELGIPPHRFGALGAVLLFSLALLLLEIPVFAGAVRLGRQIETRLRIAFLRKIPKLGDRYFQSRLTSDMAERSHSTHRLRHLPDLLRQLMRSGCELAATGFGIAWLEPSAAPWVVLILLAALLPAFTTRSMLAERDLRARSHAAALTGFYLDAMLGLVPIRAHSAERNIRREHDHLLGAWAKAAFALQKAVVWAEAVQLLTVFGLVVSLMVFRAAQGSEMARVLLVVYWILNIPVLGQEIAVLSRQYPYYRNLILRLLDPLGAAEETQTGNSAGEPLSAAPKIEFQDVSVEVSGNQILQSINVNIEPGSHIAIVGGSGAGKSSLAALLLGFLNPTEGRILVDGAPLNSEQLQPHVAWVDPAIRLWNRSLLSNLSYGSDPDSASIAGAVDAASLQRVLERLPEGLQTQLGEGGMLVSGGEGQRVRLGRALIRDHVRLVILDEPFRGLDREKRRELLTRARRLWDHCTLLCITHDIEETADFDRVLVIENGRIVEDGTPSTLRKVPESRYVQFLEAERQVRVELWASEAWRHVRIEAGELTEEPATVSDEHTSDDYSSLRAR